MEIDKDKKEATLTIRLIRSFVHTNWKPFVIHKIDLNLVTTEDLFKIIYASLPHAKLPPPFLSYKGFDTLKVKKITKKLFWLMIILLFLHLG